MTTALIILAEGFEDLEAITTTDLLVRGGVELTRAGLKSGPVRGSRHTQLVPDCTLDEALQREYDLVVLPGGLPGADHLAGDARVLGLLRRQVQQHKYVAAICAAPRALVEAGLHIGKTLSCFPGALAAMNTEGCAVSGDAVVIDLPLITSRGPGTAIEFALTLVELLQGKEVRQSVWDSLAA